jgi:hypothetical protein
MKMKRIFLKIYRKYLLVKITIQIIKITKRHKICLIVALIYKMINMNKFREMIFIAAKLA